MPFTMRWGVGLRSLVFSHYSKKKDTYSYDEIKIAVEMGSVSGQDKIFTAGIQYAFLNTLLLRLGYNKRITYGLGLRFSDVLQLDYAYLPQNGDIEHRLAAVYRWGNKYKDEFTPSDKALTDDFQKTYKMASRLYNRYLKDSIAMIDANQLESAIKLLQKIPPLNPQNKEAEKMLEVAKNKLSARKVDKLLNDMQTAEKNKNKVRAYQSALAAFDINPQRVKDILLPFTSFLKSLSSVCHTRASGYPF